MTMALQLPFSVDARAAALRNKSMDCLAPFFRAAVEEGLAACHLVSVDAVVFETCRNEELQQLYFENRSSRARSALDSWHGYGLAVDVISREHGWDYYPGGRLYEANPFWWHELYSCFKHAGLESGADWHGFIDYPHWQFGTLKASPSDRARELFASGGKQAVWKEVGACA